MLKGDLLKEGDLPKKGDLPEYDLLKKDAAREGDLHEGDLREGDLLEGDLLQEGDLLAQGNVANSHFCSGNQVPSCADPPTSLPPLSLWWTRGFPAAAVHRARMGGRGATRITTKRAGGCNR